MVKFRVPVVAAVAAVSLLAGVASADAPMTKRQAAALAQSLKLTADDLPGYTLAHVVGSTDRKAEDKWLACAGGVPRDRTLADFRGRTFQAPDSIAGSRGYAFVDAVVKVQPSAALATRELARVRSTHGKKCERKYLLPMSAKANLRFSLKDLPDPAPGAWLQRVRIRYADLSGLVLHEFVDLLWFRRGRVEFILGFSTEGQPFPAAEEQRVFNLMLARAQQQIP
jgi:hypothetical protein